MKIVEEFDNLRIAYSDILYGWTYSEAYKCYAKHLTDKDYSDLVRQKNTFFNEKVKEGVPTEKQKIEEALLVGSWTEADEDELLSYELQLSDNTKRLEKLVVQSQRDSLQAVLNEIQSKLSKKREEKYKYTNPNANYYALKHFTEIIPWNSFFKDREFKERLYTKEEFDNLEEEEISLLNYELNYINSKYSENVIRTLSVLPMVMNPLTYCKSNIYNFLGKPIVEYTQFQMDLLSKAMRNINILENAEKDPPSINETTESSELVDWYDIQYQKLMSKTIDGSEGQARVTNNTVVRNRR